MKPEKVPGVLNAFTCKCPRCRKGNLFTDPNPYRLKRTLKMYDQCAVCGQPFEIEVGFYYGSSYVSYALSLLISVVSLVLWWLLIGIGLYDNRLFYWVITNAVLLLALQPLLMRLARTIWLWFFVRFDHDWQNSAPHKPERVNKEQMNNW